MELVNGTSASNMQLSQPASAGQWSMLKKVQGLQIQQTAYCVQAAASLKVLRRSSLHSYLCMELGEKRASCFAASISMGRQPTYMTSVSSTPAWNRNLSAS